MISSVQNREYTRSVYSAFRRMMTHIELAQKTGERYLRKRSGTDRVSRSNVVAGLSIVAVDQHRGRGDRARPFIYRGCAASIWPT